MLNLQNLKYFHDACRFGSMTEAAKFNLISRPAISHAIRRLESELGADLLRHQRRGFELTDRGRLLAHEAGRLFEQVNALEVQVSSLNKTNLRGTLKLGVARILATRHLDQIVEEFKKLHPKVDFHVTLQNSATLVAQLENREIDLALIIGEESRPNIESKVVKMGNFVLVSPKNRRFSELRIAVTERRPETDRLRNIYQEKWNQPLPVFAEIPSWDVIWEWVTRGSCGGLVPDLYFEKKKLPTNIAVVIRKVSPYEVRCLTRVSSSESIILKEFVMVVSKWYQKRKSG
jgi:DNA-binding transcriptional LysR family regulator